jgi:hypothetical protein
MAAQMIERQPEGIERELLAEDKARREPLLERASKRLNRDYRTLPHPMTRRHMKNLEAFFDTTVEEVAQRRLEESESAGEIPF